MSEKPKKLVGAEWKLTGPRGPGRSRLVLAVDDDPVNLKVCKAMVEGLGYLYEGASSGRDALEMLTAVQAGVVLLDIMMPSMDGFEVCREIRKMFPGVGPRIVYLTARNMENDVKTALETGADDYLVKPIQLPVLRARLKHWFETPPRGE